MIWTGKFVFSRYMSPNPVSMPKTPYRASLSTAAASHARDPHPDSGTFANPYHRRGRFAMKKTIAKAGVISAALGFGSAALAFEDGKLTVWINGDKGYNGLAEVGKKFTEDTGIEVEVSHPDKVEERFQQVASNAQGHGYYVLGS